MAQGTTHTSTERSASRRTRSKESTANNVLRSDHERVLDMFKQYEDLKRTGADARRKQELAHRICNELKVHTQIENEIYYPKIREMTDRDSLLNEALVEHDSAESLIRQIESMAPDERLYDAKVKVLGEYTRHHIQEEHEEMFPLAHEAGVDTQELGEQLLARKDELQKRLH